MKNKFTVNQIHPSQPGKERPEQVWKSFSREKKQMISHGLISLIVKIIDQKGDHENEPQN